MSWVFYNHLLLISKIIYLRVFQPAMKDKAIYEIALGMIPGVGGMLSRQLVSYCGSAEKVFKTPKGKLKKIPGIGKHLSESITSYDYLAEAEKQLEQSRKKGIRILFYTDKDYPDRLRQIHDSPTLLYYKGTVDLNAAKTVGIVGTRKATEYGKEAVEKIIQALAPHQPLIISGLAYGIDIAAHKSALQNKLPTIGVMATGLDVIYPSVHRETARKMEEGGGLITEYELGSKPEPSRFPARNRIIAGLADVLIVVEAAEKGGALITAEIANGYNREVFAVPGNVGHTYSEGCNKLIRNHKAHIYTGIEDLEYVMNWVAGEGIKLPDKKAALQSDLFSPEEQLVIGLLDNPEGILIDELSWKSNIPLSRLASILLTLEFQSIVKSLPGKRYKLN